MTDIKLPTPHNSPPPKPAPFTRGQLVQLKTCPSAVPGVVLTVKRGKVHVRWVGDANYVGRHRPDTLVLADDQKPGTATPQPRQAASLESR